VGYSNADCVSPWCSSRLPFKDSDAILCRLPPSFISFLESGDPSQENVEEVVAELTAMEELVTKVRQSRYTSAQRHRDLFKATVSSHMGRVHILNQRLDQVRGRRVQATRSRLLSRRFRLFVSIPRGLFVHAAASGIDPAMRPVFFRAHRENVCNFGEVRGVQWAAGARRGEVGHGCPHGVMSHVVDRVFAVVVDAPSACLALMAVARPYAWFCNAVDIGSYLLGLGDGFVCRSPG
jgi:hypothetical protein